MEEHAESYASAQHPTKQEARLRVLQREHTELQHALGKYHASVHLRLFLLGMLSPPPTAPQVEQWLKALSQHE